MIDNVIVDLNCKRSLMDKLQTIKFKNALINYIYEGCASIYLDIPTETYKAHILLEGVECYKYGEQICKLEIFSRAIDENILLSGCDVDGDIVTIVENGKFNKPVYKKYFVYAGVKLWEV